MKKDSEEKRKFSVNLPKIGINLLSVTRVIGAGLIGFLLANYGLFWATLATAIFFLTDAVDGTLARLTKNQTWFGTLVDPIADKALTISICVTLCFILSPLFALPIIGELAIHLSGMNAIKDNRNLKASKTGKLKAIVIGIALCAGMGLTMIPNLTPLLATILSGIVIAPSTISQILTFKSYEKEYQPLDVKKVTDVIKANTETEREVLNKIKDKAIEVSKKSTFFSEFQNTLANLVEKPKEEINPEIEMIRDNIDTIAKQRDLYKRKKKLTQIVSQLFDTPFCVNNPHAPTGDLLKEYVNVDTNEKIECEDFVRLIAEEQGIPYTIKRED